MDFADSIAPDRLTGPVTRLIRDNCDFFHPLRRGREPS
jgi:hypothetical protein